MTRQRDTVRQAVNGLTPAMEDYLKAIYLLDRQGIAVTTQALARRMNVSPPSVTEMSQRLASIGLVERTRFHPVVLTSAGESAAVDVVERYQLVRSFLVDTLGYAGGDGDREADRLEHAVSDRLRARLEVSCSLPDVAGEQQATA